MAQDQFRTPGSPNWRGHASAGEGPKGAAARRKKKLLGLVAVSLALLGTLAALLFYPRGVTLPDFLTLSIREYKFPHYRPNALVVQDGQLLAKRFTHGAVDNSYDVQESVAILRKLNDLRKKTDRPVVIHLCALARWDDGKVYVLGGDANPNPGRSETWVLLKDVLQEISACPAPGKLLLLDLMRPIADARLGILADDIAAKVHAELSQEKDLPFHVLGACSDGQVSLVAEELGHSIFAYYLDQGLRGLADGHGPHGNKNSLVTVEELAAFVKERVDRWAWHYRGVRQTPFLLRHGTDFPLTQIDGQAPEPPADYTPPEKFPDWLKKGWGDRDAERATLGRLAPGVLRHAEALLLLAERRWRGGKEEGGLQAELKSELARLKEESKRIDEARRPMPALSLALAFIDKKGPNPALVDAVRTLWLKAQDPAVKRSEKDKAEKVKLDQEVDKLVEAHRKAPQELAKAVVDAALATAKLEPAQVLLAHQILQELKAPFAETVLLERVKALLDDVRANEDGDWPALKVRQALATLRAAERACAELAHEPAALPWLKELLKAADKERREGEHKLFKVDQDQNQWAAAARHLENAERLYGIVLQRLERVRDARRQWDRALDLMPGLGLYFSAQATDNARAASAWNAAATAAKNLGEVLIKNDVSRAADAVVADVAKLRLPLNELEDAYLTQVTRSLALGDQGTALDYWEIQALLESPRLEAPRREALWQAGQKLALQLHDQFGKLTAAAELGNNPIPDWEKARRTWRARQAIDLVRLAGFTQADPLAQQFQKMGDQAETASWQALADDLSALWSRRLLAPWQDQTEDRPGADRLSRVLSPFDVEEHKSRIPGHWSRNPTLALYRRHLAGYGQWLGERWDAESSALDAASPLRRFYRDGADAFRKAAAGMQ